MHDISYENENESGARDYTPAHLRQRNETQTAVKIQPTMHYVSDSIVSKKRFGCDSRELAGSDFSQESSDIEKSSISSIDC